MDRRRFLLTSLAGAFAAPLAAEAQQAGRVYRIGWLSVLPRSVAVDELRKFSTALHRHGYSEGRTFLIEDRFAEGRLDSLRDFASELVGLKVDVIVTDGTNAALTAKQATASIPIVVIGPADLVGVGLGSSLAKPGGNVTGVSAGYRDIAAKCVELLRETIPGLTRIGFVGNAANVVNRTSFAQAAIAATTLGLTIEYFSASKPSEVGRALDALSRARIQGVVVSGDGVVSSRAREIVGFVARARIPTVYFIDDHVTLGGLMSYGPRLLDLYRHAAIYVDKILKGAKPADLPVEQPTKFELVINLKTARALGLTNPPSLLLRADQVVACPEKGRCD